MEKAELKAEQEIQTFDSNCIQGKSHFEDDGLKNYLVFKPTYKCFKKIGNSKCISAWKSKGLSD